MDLLASYDDGSNTPKVDRSREDSGEKSPKHLSEYNRMMESLHSSKTSDKAGKKTLGKDEPHSGARSDSDSDSSDDSDSDDEAEPNKTATSERRGSVSSDLSTASSSVSESGKSDASKKSSKEKDTADKDTADKDRRMSSTSKASTRRSRSRSGSKGRRRRRSSERHRRSRSRDRHHKSSRSERRSGRRSHSRSRSRDRHTRRRSRDRRRRDGHRRRHHSSSRDKHRHRRRSPGHRHRRHSRSPDKKSHHSEKRRRSRSPRPGSSKAEEPSSTGILPSSSTFSSRPPVFKTAGVKFGRGRGALTGSYKDKLKEEYIQQVQQAHDVVSGHSMPMTRGPTQVTSSVATVSAGTGVMGPGGMNQILINQMQQLKNMHSYVPGQPGVLTEEQKVLNQRYLLQATGRTREQVEATYGIKIPEIYNESTNNLVEIAERSKKRSLLWKAHDKTKTEKSNFNAVPVLPGHNKSDNLKFARLLGSKKGKAAEEKTEEGKDDEKIDDAEEKAIYENQVLNANLYNQFESSRVFTHIHRGMGLGYSSTSYQPL